MKQIEVWDSISAIFPLFMMSTLEYSNQSPQHSAIIERLSEGHNLSDPKAGLVQKAAAKEGFSELAQAEVARAEWCRWSWIGIVQSGNLIGIIRYHQCITPRVVLPLSQPGFLKLVSWIHTLACWQRDPRSLDPLNVRITSARAGWQWFCTHCFRTG